VKSANIILKIVIMSHQAFCNFADLIVNFRQTCLVRTGKRYYQPKIRIKYSWSPCQIMYIRKIVSLFISIDHYIWSKLARWSSCFDKLKSRQWIIAPVSSVNLILFCILTSLVQLLFAANPFGKKPVFRQQISLTFCFNILTESLMRKWTKFMTRVIMIMSGIWKKFY